MTQPAPMWQTDFLQASVGEARRLYAFVIALIAGVVVLVVFYIHVQRDLDKERMHLAANPEAENVR